MTGSEKDEVRGRKNKEDKAEAGRIKCNFLRRERLVIKTGEREIEQRDEREEERKAGERDRGGLGMGGRGGSLFGTRPALSGTGSSGKPQRLPCPIAPQHPPNPRPHSSARQTAEFMLELKGFVLHRWSFEKQQQYQ